MTASPSPLAVARDLTVTGRVQGVGFRPFVYRLAHRHGLAGWVRNTGGEVDIHIEGADPARLQEFSRELVAQAPPLARPTLQSDKPSAAEGLSGFSILKSEATAAVDIHVPPDQFACEDCLGELNDPAARRFRYPFINCTQCGPRYTIIRAMPYDRPNTTLAGFELCPDCRREYENPLDRRFHAQPLACPVCGPRLSWSSAREPGYAIEDSEQALLSCLCALRAGEIVAVRGIGGYHLVCDAADERAVARLRERKHRPDKPLAVMIPATGGDGLGWARTLARITPEEADALRDPVRPIVLVERREEAPLACGIAPNLTAVGLMLPYSPLHHLLLDAFQGPLVATSGNISGEPVLTAPRDAEARLDRVADAYLHHNRPIERPADDPVLRPMAGGMQPIRLGRGIAPLELALPFRLERPMLAVGAFMKTTVALAWEDRVVVSPHIGDLSSPRSRRVFEQVCGDLQGLYGIEAEALACDAHPDFPNSRWAAARGKPVTRILHHHAHASAAAGEFALLDEPVLCFTWDGTGLGDDGTIWGGEALLGGPGNWRRVASWRTLRLPGGERAMLEPWRSALAACWDAGLNWAAGEARATPLLEAAWRDGVNSPRTSSVGRLFDAAAAIVAGIHEASYDGQAPMQLETLARGTRAEAIPLPIADTRDGMLVADWEPLFGALLDDDRPAADRAALVHATFAQALVDQATALRTRQHFSTVALSGGVFQNRILTEAVIAGLEAAGFRTLFPRRIPVNDGGIAYGQIVEAAAQAGLARPLAAATHRQSPGRRR